MWTTKASIYVTTCSHEELKLAYEELSVAHDNVVQDHAFLTKELSKAKTLKSENENSFLRNSCEEYKKLLDSLKSSHCELKLNHETLLASHDELLEQHASLIKVLTKKLKIMRAHHMYQMINHKLLLTLVM